jgi:hypothetical protein
MEAPAIRDPARVRLHGETAKRKPRWRELGDGPCSLQLYVFTALYTNRKEYVLFEFKILDGDEKDCRLLIIHKRPISRTHLHAGLPRPTNIFSAAFRKVFGDGFVDEIYTEAVKLSKMGRRKTLKPKK